MKYDFKLSFITLDNDALEYIQGSKKNNPGKVILVELLNTRGTSSEAIRKLPNDVVVKVAVGRFSSEAYIYSKAELIQILKEIERLEQGINDNWSNIQKALYIYDELRSNIKYDPKYETSPTSKIRTLRGLIEKESVCAGMAIIYKELLDRHQIPNDIVCGSVINRPRKHAWNLLYDGENIFPIDLTYDIGNYSIGNFKTTRYFASADGFVDTHIPDDKEKVTDYSCLKSISEDFIRRARSRMASEKESWVGTCINNDGLELFVAQLGNNEKAGQTYYRYLVSKTHIDDEGNTVVETPFVFYSKSNLVKFSSLVERMQEELKNYKIDRNADHKIQLEQMEELKRRKTLFAKALIVRNKTISEVFSRKNINDSLSKKSRYLGQLHVERGEDSSVICSLQKSDEELAKVSYEFKHITRSDGTKLVVERIPSKAKIPNLHLYFCTETINLDGKIVVKTNSVVSEMDLLNDNRVDFADKFLSRERLDKECRVAGGYIGFFDASGNCRYNQELRDKLIANSRLELTDGDIVNQKKAPVPTNIDISFEDLRDCVLKYRVTRDSTTGKIAVAERKTNQLVTDSDIIKIAIFANAWVFSTGTIRDKDEKESVFEHAFRDGAKKTYEFLKATSMVHLTEKGCIDSLELYDLAESRNAEYKHIREVIASLFKSTESVQAVNDFFRLQTFNAKDQIEPSVVIGKQNKDQISKKVSA